MKIIVGLGNPDGIYTKTYHNIGYMAVDKFAKLNKLDINKNKCRAKIVKTPEYVLAKPITYMNLSGDSVLELKKYFKVSNDDILIVYDDIDLPKGTIRYREKGSAGTHNGMRDIISKVGETPRLRIGIGRPDNMDLKDYVLSNIDAMSKELFDKAFIEAFDKIMEFINKD
ncbi:MAG: aminoacyl-tRNA hydrolase [Clostridia bacterium]|nr:aminoacyl-tRNA hydrolase [Clostridia bacterium]